MTFGGDLGLDEFRMFYERASDFGLVGRSKIHSPNGSSYARDGGGGDGISREKPATADGRALFRRPWARAPRSSLGTFTYDVHSGREGD